MSKTIGLLASLFTILAGSLWAGQLSQPQGPVILSVTGDLARTNVEDRAEFDLEMLRALPVEQFDTTTIWTEGTKSFTGVPLQTLLAEVGAEGTMVLASAINDYTVEIPVDSLGPNAPLVAYELNGEIMSRRQKGPLWIVYPFDSDAEFRSEVIYARSIWQLDRLEVVK